MNTCDINSEVFSKQSERVSLDSVPNVVPFDKQQTFSLHKYPSLQYYYIQQIN